MSNLPICLDAGVVIRLIADPNATSVAELFDRWADRNRLLIAPVLLHFEVTNTLYQYYKHNVLSEDAILLALQAAQSLPVKLHQPVQLHQQAVKFAQKYNLLATYDAHYLALAEMMSAEFWTANIRLFNLVADSLAWVYPIK